MDWMAALLFLVKGDKEDFKAVFKAQRDFKKWKPSLQEKRKRLPQRGHLTGMYRQSIVFDHYLRHIQRFSQLDPEKFEA